MIGLHLHDLLNSHQTVAIHTFTCIIIDCRLSNFLMCQAQDVLHFVNSIEYYVCYTSKDAYISSINIFS